MSLTPQELIIAGNGTLYHAPEGTTLPTSLSDALDPAFQDVGYTTEDGAMFTDSKTTNSVRGWQSFYPVRTHITERSGMIETSLMQWNEPNMQLAYGGGAIVETTPGEYRYEPPEPEDLAVNALVLDIVDGDRNFRIVVARAFVTSDVESTFAKTGPALLPVTFEVLDAGTGVKPWTIDSDDPAWAPVTT